VNRVPHLAVIGSGIAGLSCATMLQQAGLEVSLFDKGRGRGGRMSTRRGGAWRPDIGLGLCGDWLNGGKVEGAWLGGRALAERVLRSFAPC
jgi:predicted NAD/FAD-dependent oxidoreductase